MKKGDLLLVYGTLRRGERMDLQRQQHAFDVSYLGKDYINGEMYSLGGFPGIKASAQQFDPSMPVITGDLFKIKNEAITALLDAYESYNADKPWAGLYNRIQTGTKRGFSAWVYIYNHPVISDQKIPSGDWCKNRNTVSAGRRLE